MPSPLLAALQTELAQINVFIQLLEHEQKALIQNTLELLEGLAKEKIGCAQVLETLAKERKRLFEVNGVALSPDVPHLMTGVQFLPVDDFPALAAIWQQLLQAARHASALNQTNGQLIETRQQQNQQLMMLLQNSHNSTMSYDAYGQPRLSRAGGSLGKV